MKNITRFFLLALAFNALNFSTLEAQSDGKNQQANSHVRISIKSDLIEDLPLNLTFATTDKRIEYRSARPLLSSDPISKPVDPRKSNTEYYENLIVEPVKNDDDSVAVVLHYDLSNGTSIVFALDQLSAILKPGEEEILFSLDDRKLVVGLIADDE